MSGDIIEYDSGPITTLFHDLQGFRKALTERAQEMKDAGAKLEAAWQGTEAYNSFHTIHQKWDGEFEDTLVILDRVAAAVETALNRALGTDGKIGDGFADL
ncbi:type VII secretion protein EsxR [Nocardia sp. NPDC050710]|uniref:WXG100 family type VII secretion target n=1 Tax=Nocardia sp. NPDC050710 TaxID=3157220 RepID=UPI0033EF34AD